MTDAASSRSVVCQVAQHACREPVQGAGQLRDRQSPVPVPVSVLNRHPQHGVTCAHSAARSASRRQHAGGLSQHQRGAAGGRLEDGGPLQIRRGGQGRGREWPNHDRRHPRSLPLGQPARSPAAPVSHKPPASAQCNVQPHPLPPSSPSHSLFLSGSACPPTYQLRPHRPTRPCSTHTMARPLANTAGGSPPTPQPAPLVAKRATWPVRKRPHPTVAHTLILRTKQHRPAMAGPLADPCAPVARSPPRKQTPPHRRYLAHPVRHSPLRPLSPTARA